MIYLIDNTGIKANLSENRQINENASLWIFTPVAEVRFPVGTPIKLVGYDTYPPPKTAGHKSGHKCPQSSNL
jgi:hypothetical protein